MFYYLIMHVCMCKEYFKVAEQPLSTERGLIFHISKLNVVSSLQQCHKLASTVLNSPRPNFAISTLKVPCGNSDTYTLHVFLLEQ